MMTLKGLVIREQQRGETSKMIYILTVEKGIIGVFVRGGMKSNKNSAATQLYVYSDFCIEEKTNARGQVNYFLNSAEAINMFFNIRLDIKKTSLCAYLTEILYYSRVEASSDKNELLRLTLNTFYYINEGKRDLELLRSSFEIRLISDTGFRANLIGCCRCYKYEDDIMYFNIASGTLECEECCDNKNSGFRIKLDRSMLYIMRYIVLTDIDKLFSLKVSPAYQEQLTELGERYVMYYFSDYLKPLWFYKSI